MCIWQNIKENKKSSKSLFSNRVALTFYSPTKCDAKTKDFQGKKLVCKNAGELFLDNTAKEAAWKEPCERLKYKVWLRPWFLTELYPVETSRVKG